MNETVSLPNGNFRQSQAPRPYSADTPSLSRLTSSPLARLFKACFVGPASCLPSNTLRTVSLPTKRLVWRTIFEVFFVLGTFGTSGADTPGTSTPGACTSGSCQSGAGIGGTDPRPPGCGRLVCVETRRSSARTSSIGRGAEMSDISDSLAFWTVIFGFA